MSNQISNEVKAQLFSQESTDPLLTLVTLTHPLFTARLVNNSRDVISNGFTFMAFPMKIRLPIDDGESNRDMSLEFDNVSLELVSNMRAVTTPIGVKMEMVLASMPDVIQMSFEDLLIRSIVYDAKRISAKIVLDNFLSVAMTSERYNPSNFPGLF